MTTHECATKRKSIKHPFKGNPWLVDHIQPRGYKFGSHEVKYIVIMSHLSFGNAEPVSE